MKLRMASGPADASRKSHGAPARRRSDEHVLRDELAQLTGELHDTNRGVVALYAELDERAEQLRQASELKSKFLSNVTHEFRTPLNSILALAALLLDGADGALTSEQERQVVYIRAAANSLTELVNDLLDIAKVEAGKLDIRAAEFGIADLFGALRGALRPLCRNDAVELIFDRPVGIDRLFTDEPKLAQILRNFISNALKFTERGEVRLSANLAPDGRVIFAVRDSGIGIAAHHHEAIFEEFEQIKNPLQSRVKGTGLGLSLARKLGGLLGGSVYLESAPGHGSTFYLALPAAVLAADLAAAPSPVRRVLLIDDEAAFRYILRQMIGPNHEVFEAGSGAEGLERAGAVLPDLIFLDLQMPGMDGYAVLDALQNHASAHPACVVIATAADIGPPERRRLAAARAIISKQNLSRTKVVAILKNRQRESVA